MVSNGYKGKIERCSFINNQTGISLGAATPYINDCLFTGNVRGILTEFSIFSFGTWSGINSSIFYGGDIGIESRSSNQRMVKNYFNRNKTGILCHAGSNHNLSYRANNVLNNREANISFYDTAPYKSTIQLYKGHNDFYHLHDNTTGLRANDFAFDLNYYNYQISEDPTIDASGNWFQDEFVRINRPEYENYVYVDLFNPAPNMPTCPDEIEYERFFTALDYESQGLNDQAIEIYKAILNEQLEAEKRYFSSAADGIYRLAFMVTSPSWKPVAYLDAKILQYAIDDPYLSSLLKEYLAKTFIVTKDYQSAVDLIQLRIDNPISEIDSLRAVLDLEIVLQLAAMEETKKPITTIYTQYNYPDIQVFNAKHEEHWTLLYELMAKKRFPEIPIPLKPLITSNYPNPFNPSTMITFSIPKAGKVNLSIYNIRGQKVRQLIDSDLVRGHHKIIWDGKDNNNRFVGSGLYFIRLEADKKANIRKVMLMK